MFHTTIPSTADTREWWFYESHRCGSDWISVAEVVTTHHVPLGGRVIADKCKPSRPSAQGRRHLQARHNPKGN
jgi:hypothetical protein